MNNNTKYVIWALCVIAGLISGFVMNSGGWFIAIVAMVLLIAFGNKTGYSSVWVFSIAAGVGLGKLMPTWWYAILLGVILGIALSIILRWRLMPPAQHKA